jgi:hypothetical protein
MESTHRSSQLCSLQMFTLPIDIVKLRLELELNNDQCLLKQVLITDFGCLLG